VPAHLDPAKNPQGTRALVVDRFVFRVGGGRSSGRRKGAANKHNSGTEKYIYIYIYVCGTYVRALFRRKI
jgi:hypothetical protein